MHRLVPSICVGIALFLFSRVVFADQITMQDGDRITGEIVKKDGDTLTVKSKNFGTVTLKWSDVAAVRTDGPVSLVLRDGQTVKGAIDTQNGQIQVGPQLIAPK